jgi:hypothetical protein
MLNFRASSIEIEAFDGGEEGVCELLLTDMEETY